MLAKTLGPAPIEGILLVDILGGPPVGQHFTSSSLPGHLLHCVIDGEVSLRSNGRTYHLKPGCVLWYHEDEWVEGAATAENWRYYSINFIAPLLPPPSYEARLFYPTRPEVRQAFEDVYQAWHDTAATPERRLFRVHSRLLHVLELLSAPASQTRHYEAEADLWWKLELEVRRDLARPLNLRQLEIWAGCSAATIARAAQAAVGQSPMRRIKQIRLSFARGLVQRSDLTFSQIAERIGYTRVHEFSRDYKALFGTSPSGDPGRR